MVGGVTATKASYPDPRTVSKWSANSGSLLKQALGCQTFRVGALRNRHMTVLCSGTLASIHGQFGYIRGATCGAPVFESNDFSMPVWNIEDVRSG
jgi:hypothetical protein